MTIATSSIRKIVIVRRYGLGNFLLALPCVDETKRLFPNAEVVLFLDPRCRAIAEMTRPDLRRVIYENMEQATGWFERERPDAVLFTYPTVDRALVTAATATSSVTVCHDIRGCAGTASINLKADPSHLETQLNLDLLRAIGVRPRFHPPRVTVSEAGKKEAARVLKKHGVPPTFVAVHPGCHGDWEAKRWPATSFAQLIDRLGERGTSVVIVGGPEEKIIADAVVRDVTSTRVFNMTGETSLMSVAGVLRRAHAMISNDSGLMHLAAAVGTPVVALFGPTSWQKNPPLVRKAAIVRRPVSCSPCFVAGGDRPRRAWCMEMITPDQVLRALDDVFAAKPHENAPCVQPFVSVIMPTFNRAKHLRPAIEALVGQSYPKDRIEIIVVDNNSTDDTANVIRSFAGVRYEFANERQSSYSARNHGIGVASGDVLAFIDDDAIAEPDWVARGVEWFEHPDVGCVAGKTAALDAVSDVAHFQARSPHLFPGPEVETAEAYGVPTVNCFWRRDTIDALGTFNDALKSGGDFDLTFRMRKDGRWCVRFAENAVVRHRHRERLEDLFKVFARYGYGSAYVAKTHRPRSVADRIQEAKGEWLGLFRRGRGIVRERMNGHEEAPRVIRLSDLPSVRSSKSIHVWIVDDGTWREYTPDYFDAVSVAKISVAPHPDYLALALDVIGKLRPPHWYLYGAGQHTRRVMRIRDVRDLGARGIVDDDPSRRGVVDGLPIVSREDAISAGMKTVVVSSDYYESALLEKLRPLKGAGVDVWGLYDPAALTRYGAMLARERREFGASYLYAPAGSLDRGHRNALAVGLGVSAVIVNDDEPPGVMSDEFLDWVSRLAYRTGRLAGCVRYGYFAP